MEKKHTDNDVTLDPTSSLGSKQASNMVCMDAFPESKSRSEEETLIGITYHIRQLPDLEPPHSLMPGIMAAVRSVRRPWWYRAYRWIKAPRSITFSPLQAMPVALAVAIICISSVLYKPNSERFQNLQSQSSQAIPVLLTVTVPAAANSVSVIGSFNNWQPQSCELKKKNGQGIWTASLVLPPGRYEYTFLVDSQALSPEANAGFRQDDGFGNQNNYLIVGTGNELRS